MKLVIGQKAEKDIARLEKQAQQRVKKAIDSMAKNPVTADLKKLQGSNTWRLRVGNYRVIIYFPEGWKEARILRVLHRQDAYK